MGVHGSLSLPFPILAREIFEAVRSTVTDASPGPPDRTVGG